LALASVTHVQSRRGLLSEPPRSECNTFCSESTPGTPKALRSEPGEDADPVLASFYLLNEDKPESDLGSLLFEKFISVFCLFM